MTRTLKPAASVAALSIFMTGTAAFADVTAQQVWDDWKSYMTGFGYEVTGEEMTDGDALTVRNVSMGLTLPEGEGNMMMSMPELSFTNNGDGTVTVGLPAVMPLEIDMTHPDPDKPKVEITIEYANDGLSMVVSGDEGDMLYTYSAAMIGMKVTEWLVGGAPLEGLNAVISIAEMSGSTAMSIGNLRVSEQQMSTGPVTYDVSFPDPESGGMIKLDGRLNTLGFEGEASFPMNMDPDDMVAMLEAGFGFDGGFTYEGGSYSLFAEDAGPSAMTLQSSSDSGSLSVAMDAAKLAYAGTSNNMRIAMEGGEVPFPVELALAEAGFNLLMPISQTEEAQDFAFGIRLAGFTMSDMIWGMFDPGGQLSRDPATVALDLTGQTRLNLDIMDPEQIESAGSDGEMPAEIVGLSINDLTLRLIGAELTGSGAFSFDNTDMTTFPGMPAPDGSVDLRLTGGNAVLDKLVAMGLLPEDQAMGARMMMGLFAVPGDGEDTLTSKIEVRPDGQVLANGQRLK